VPEQDVIPYVPCRCGCRPDGAPEPCACPECRPGPGLAHQAVRRARDKPRETRMMLLLHQKALTALDQVELDDLLDWYIHRD
jgi:hypothetical protein